jgi:hypothetical protein
LQQRLDCRQRIAGKADKTNPFDFGQFAIFIRAKFGKWCPSTSISPVFMILEIQFQLLIHSIRKVNSAIL